MGDKINRSIGPLACSDTEMVGSGRRRRSTRSGDSWRVIPSEARDPLRYGIEAIEEEPLRDRLRDGGVTRLAIEDADAVMRLEGRILHGDQRAAARTRTYAERASAANQTNGRKERRAELYASGRIMIALQPLLEPRPASRFLDPLGRFTADHGSGRCGLFLIFLAYAKHLASGLRDFLVCPVRFFPFEDFPLQDFLFEQRPQLVRLHFDVRDAA